MATTSLRLCRVGGRLELAISVAVGGGDAHYGAVALGPQGLRRLLQQLRAHLWRLERDEAAETNASNDALVSQPEAARGLAP
jgi:hypothetical protein